MQAKVEFKKDHGFSPDRFDTAIHTFFKDDPISEAIIPKEQVETMEFGRFIQQSSEGQSPQSFRSMQRKLASSELRILTGLAL